MISMIRFEVCIAVIEELVIVAEKLLSLESKIKKNYEKYQKIIANALPPVPIRLKF